MTRVQHRLFLEYIDRRHARASGVQGVHQRTGRDKLRAARVYDQRRRLHSRQVASGHNAARCVDQAQVQGNDVAFLEKSVLGGRGMAWVYDRYVTDRSLYRLQDAANKAAGVGFWGDPAPIPPSDYRRAKPGN